MIRKLIASCCLALMVLSFAACGPGDPVTVDSSDKTLPGDGTNTPDPSKPNTGLSTEPQG